MSVINYYGNLIVELDGDEVYIRCFNAIFKPLKGSLSKREDADIVNFQGDVYDDGVDQYDTLSLRYSPFSIKLGDDKLILEDSMIDKILEFLD